MDAPKDHQPAQGGTVSWSAEAVLAAGIVAGTLIARLRNPRAALLLAAGALAWRAMRPKQRPAPMLSLPLESVEPIVPVVESRLDPVMETPSIERTVMAPVVMEAEWSISEPVSAIQNLSMPEPEPVALAPEAVVTEVLPEPEPEPVMATPEEPRKDLPPVVEAVAVAPTIHQPMERCDAWIMGLEPLPVVEEMPEQPVFEPIVQEHRPVIAEGAPLPDMIEISLEPAATGLQVAIAPVSEDAQPLIVNEGPVPVVAVPAPAPAPLSETAPVVVEVPIIKPKTVLPPPVFAPAAAPLPDFPPAPMVPVLTGKAEPANPWAVAKAPPVPVPAPVLDPVAQAAEAAKIWASFEAQPASPASEKITLRPMPRTSPNPTGELTAGSKKAPVFGQPLPSSSPTVPEWAPAADQPRRIVPHAPVTGSDGGESKSWLNFWK